jgi:hypothetical protein
VSSQTGTDGRIAYGLADLVQGHACWLGPREWRATGAAGRDVAEHLWRTFLDAGGPWPTEFRLRAAGRDRTELRTRAAGDRLTFRRHGPRCTQVWELVEPRDRAGWP